jgi:hypothetical protein
VSEPVQGYCPMGCGRTLFLASGGYITCARDKCPDPGAASDLLADAEHEHIAVLGEDTFSIQHPLRAYVSGLDGPPRRPGRYRVRQSGDRFSWETLS